MAGGSHREEQNRGAERLGRIGRSLRNRREGAMTQQNNRSSPAASAGAPAPTAGEVKEQVKDAAGQAKEMAGQAVEQAQETVGKVVDQAKEQTTSQLAEQKSRAAGSLGTVAQALRQTGQGLRDQEQDAAGRYADGVAQQVERFADYLRGHD